MTMIKHRGVLLSLTMCAALLAGGVGVSLAASPAAAAGVPAGLHVSGNHLLDSAGGPVVLRGVDRSGSEYACIQGFGFFDGPSDATSISAMASWHINAVRVPLNEDCWLGINNSPAAYSGTNYRSAIEGYVSRLHAAGLVAILDLHWTAAGTSQSTGQQDMPDADHAGAFWTSVAGAFKADRSTVFDLFNEPHDVSWTCWRDGGDCGIGYQVAGMQSLVNAVRATGATNPVLIGGLAYANDLSSWLAYRPTDPTGNELASWHSYNFNTCSTVSCWTSQIAPVAAQVPLVAGEVGENDCAHGYLDTLLPWLDSHSAGYLGWGWDPYSCGSFPALITSYDGTPTSFGIGLRNHLAALAGAPTTTSTPTSSTSTSSTSASSTPTSSTSASGTSTSSSSPSSTSASSTSTSASSTSATPTSSTPTTTPTATPTTSTVSPTISSSTSSGAPATFAVSPVELTSSSPYWWEEDLNITFSSNVSALTVTITVARTAGVSNSGFYADAPGGALTLTETTRSNSLVYQATLNSGQTLSPGVTIKLGAQYSGNGTAHPVAGDSYQITGMVNGQRASSAGTF